MMLLAIQDAFREGGWGMYPTLVFGLWANVESARQIWRPSPSFRAAIALAAVTLLSGLLGTVSGFIKTLAYAVDHPYEQMVRFAFIGLSETLHNLALAMVMLVFSSLLYAIAHLRRR
jgi:hypothetical protein